MLVLLNLRRRLVSHAGDMMSQCLCLKVSVGRLPLLIAWKARPRNPSGEGVVSSAI